MKRKFERRRAFHSTRVGVTRGKAAMRLDSVAAGSTRLAGSDMT
jgi:hypothetical protein